MKNNTCILRSIITTPKIDLKMKLTFILLLTTLLNINASSYSQKTKISLNLNDATVEKVFSKIMDKTDFKILYAASEIDLQRKISIKIKNQRVEKVLDILFANSMIRYNIVGKQIVLAKTTPKSGIIIKKTKIEKKPGIQNLISGKVIDEAGIPLPGVNIIIEGTTVGTQTDFDGKYSIQANSGDILDFSYVGMKTQIIKVGLSNTIDVVMAYDESTLEEVVVVGYGNQKKGVLTGSIASIKTDELVITPTTSVSNSLAGKLPGLFSKQNTGQPGADAASINIRGFGNALIIVDGIETSLNDLDPYSIESISILKDGAASIYGARAGNGVILVTTKRGKIQKPTISLNSTTSFQGITAMPTPVSAGQFTEMQSEAWLQSGQPAANVPYTPEEIQKYYDGTDPLYPSTSWYDELVRDWAPQQQLNLSIRGGSERIKYNGSFGYLNQESMWKKNGGEYERYNFLANVDMKVTDNLSIQMITSYTSEFRDFPKRSSGIGGNSLWQDLWMTLPIYPATLPDASKLSWGGYVGGIHAASNSEISGYSRSDIGNLKGTFIANYAFENVKGLSVKAFINVEQRSSYNKSFSKPMVYYTYNPESGEYLVAGSLHDKASLKESMNKGKTKTQQYSINYDNTFAEDHHISAIALYESIDVSGNWFSAGRINFLTPAIDQLFAGSTTGMTNNGAANEYGRKSYLGRLNYSFKNKYLLETSLRADASAKFSPENQWGYFPSISLGWVLSQENFMDSSKNLDLLKLRLSYGKSGNDNVGNFQYLSGYKFDETYILGSSPRPGLVSTGLANPDLTWEELSIYNIGIDFSIWQHKLYGEADVFYRERSGIPATRGSSLPSTFGASLPSENLNSLNNRGVELELGTSGESNDFSWNFSGNISYSRAKWDYFEEPDYEDPDQERLYKRSGNWVNRQFGLLSDGLFTSQDQIDNLGFDQDQKGNTTLRLGDIRFKDINNDGILDWKDNAEIGKSTFPEWIYGIKASMRYKGFDFNVLFQGAFNFYNYVVLTQATVSPAIVYEERWTEENNNANALVPRLGGAATNSYFSDYYYKKADYIRLKELSIGYSLPNSWLSSVKMEQMRIYFAGTNLLTFSGLNKYGVDPESPSGQAGYYYPQQKVLTLGVNLSF